MSDLITNYNNIKQKYRELFNKMTLDIQFETEKLNPNHLNEDLFIEYDKNSDGEKWQFAVYDYFKNRLNQNIKKTNKLIRNKKLNYQCCCCGSCCKLAISEYSYDELKEKAKNGDKYASQFIEVFIPYTDINEVISQNKEYFELLKENDISDVYYYHCPKVTNVNKCSDYEHRPDICKEFPDNPLGFLPKTCVYNNWLNNVREISLQQSAETEIITFYLNKLEKFVHNVNIK